MMPSNLAGLAVHLRNLWFKPMSFASLRSSGWKHLLSLVVLLLSTATAAAEIYHVAPAPGGSDANDCLSPSTQCATFQRAVDLCPSATHCTIQTAPGVYSQKTNVVWYKAISITGPRAGDATCADRSAVVVDDRIDGVGQAGAIFMGQDHAILTISCMTLAAHANGSVGFAARQFVVGDVNDVDFRRFPAGLGIAAEETSKINVVSPGIHGDASRFVSAGGLSQVTISGAIRIGDGLTFEVAFLSALSNSIVSVYPSTIVGGTGTMFGASYQCKDAIIQKNVTLPGGDVPYVGNDNCKVFGLAPDKVIRDGKLDPIYSELKAIQTELGVFRNARREQRRKDRVRDGIVAVLAVLSFAALGVAAYALHRYRRR